MLDLNWAEILVGAILGVVVGAILAEPVRRLWSSLLNEVLDRRVIPIRGRWTTTYWYVDDDGKRRERQDAIRLRQTGTHVWGKNEGVTDHEYLMSGHLRNQRFLTGTWASKRERVYHGAYQLVVAHNGKSMRGRWVGFDDRNLVRQGEWLWQKLG